MAEIGKVKVGKIGGTIEVKIVVTKKLRVKMFFARILVRLVGAIIGSKVNIRNVKPSLDLMLHDYIHESMVAGNYFTEAARVTTRVSEHLELLIGIGNDHVAYLTMEPEAYNVLHKMVTGETEDVRHRVKHNRKYS